MVDSHALVGSCAQIGKRVHLSAAAQIGGVLEPGWNASPVVIEDDALVGGNCGVYEGTVVKKRAVLAAVSCSPAALQSSSRQGNRLQGTADRRSRFPKRGRRSGARAVKQGWGAAEGLSLQAPVIVKYRDDRRISPPRSKPGSVSDATRSRSSGSAQIGGSVALS